MTDRPPLREPTFFVLMALLPAPLHGYGIIKAVEEMSDGSRAASAPARSTRRSNAGERGLRGPRPGGKSEGGPPRRYYRLTPAGRHAARGREPAARRQREARPRRAAAREAEHGMSGYDVLFGIAGRLVGVRYPERCEEIVETPARPGRRWRLDAAGRAGEPRRPRVAARTADRLGQGRVAPGRVARQRCSSRHAVRARDAVRAGGAVRPPDRAGWPRRGSRRRRPSSGSGGWPPPTSVT